MRTAVLTVSDRVSRGEADDGSGDLLEELLREDGHEVERRTVADERPLIAAAITELAHAARLVLTTGGTGLAPRDVTPEAVRPLLRREMDGFAAVFHGASWSTIGVSTIQSRAFAGQIDDTFIFCLPGSTGACRDGWDLVLALELDSRYRPCSLAGQIPRLRDFCA